VEGTPIDKPPTLPALVAMQMQYAASTNDWLLGRTVGEGAPAYHYMGVQFRVFDAPTATQQTRPLYRCRTGAAGAHYQSNLATCEGGVFEGLLGFVYENDPKDGAQQILRCTTPSLTAFVATLNAADCQRSGLVVIQTTLGWAYPPN
jgi:hypothetical protein